MIDLVEKQAVIDALVANESYDLEHAIAAIRELPPANRWIPVSERMPNENEIVLVCGNSGGVYTAIYKPEGKDWPGWWKLNSRLHECNPLAWTPVPDRYEKAK